MTETEREKASERQGARARVRASEQQTGAGAGGCERRRKGKGDCARGQEARSGREQPINAEGGCAPARASAWLGEGGGGRARERGSARATERARESARKGAGSRQARAGKQVLQAAVHVDVEHGEQHGSILIPHSFAAPSSRSRTSSRDLTGLSTNKRRPLNTLCCGERVARGCVGAAGHPAGAVLSGGGLPAGTETGSAHPPRRRCGPTTGLPPALTAPAGARGSGRGDGQRDL